MIGPQAVAVAAGGWAELKSVAGGARRAAGWAPRGA